ncbi:MAG: hypothetical protein WKF57_10150 [Nakamurella sp.]
MQTPMDLDERFEPFDELGDEPWSPTLIAPRPSPSSTTITADVRVGAGQR